jgi:hypothetical protein
MRGIDCTDSIQYPILTAVQAKAFFDGTSASFFGFEIDVINVHILSSGWSFLGCVLLSNLASRHMTHSLYALDVAVSNPLPAEPPTTGSIARDKAKKTHIS